MWLTLHAKVVIHGVLALLMFSAERTLCVNVHVSEATHCVLTLLLSADHKQEVSYHAAEEEQQLSVTQHST